MVLRSTSQTTSQSTINQSIPWLKISPVPARCGGGVGSGTSNVCRGWSLIVFGSLHSTWRRDHNIICRHVQAATNSTILPFIIFKYQVIDMNWIDYLVRTTYVGKWRFKLTSATLLCSGISSQLAAIKWFSSKCTTGLAFNANRLPKASNSHATRHGSTKQPFQVVAPQHEIWLMPKSKRDFSPVALMWTRSFQPGPEESNQQQS